jgi:hypothetical protein
MQHRPCSREGSYLISRQRKRVKNKKSRKDSVSLCLFKKFKKRLRRSTKRTK